jgi:cytochrome P450
MMRLPTVKDVRDFKPERWLGDSEERIKMERNNLSFGQGSRVCIGKNISLMEMSKLVTTFIHRYDVEVANQDKPYRTIEHWFTPQTDFFARMTRRLDST